MGNIESRNKVSDLPANEIKSDQKEIKLPIDDVKKDEQETKSEIVAAISEKEILYSNPTPTSTPILSGIDNKNEVIENTQNKIEVDPIDISATAKIIVKKNITNSNK